MTKVLIVDDEIPLLRNLSSYLGSFEPEFDVMTSPSAEEALEILQKHADFDILLTDVRLPGMDGIELVQRAVGLRKNLKLLVMTAFSSQKIRRGAVDAGALRYLEKPLDLKKLRQVLLEIAATNEGWSGSVGGLDLFDFTQLFTLSGKTTQLKVQFGNEQGMLAFRQGQLVHASAGDLLGDEAFYSMTTWQGGTFEEVTVEENEALDPNMQSSPSHLLMEAARRRDEAKNKEGDSEFNDKKARHTSTRINHEQTTDGKESREMSVKDLLVDFEEVQGFQGVAVFTPQGEMIESVAKGKMDIKTVGTYANNALLNAQKATDQMGVGRGNLMQIRAPQAVVLMRCLNEATDFAATKEGKAHFHTVVVLDPEGNTGMASMFLDKVAAGIAEELR
ncbi:MAG: response regulator [bacterium]|nr:response regulator [bacterium]